MGEIADLAIYGFCCEWCMEPISEEGLGHPGLCPSCAQERAENYRPKNCDLCGVPFPKRMRPRLVQLVDKETKLTCVNCSREWHRKRERIRHA